VMVRSFVEADDTETGGLVRALHRALPPESAQRIAAAITVSGGLKPSRNSPSFFIAAAGRLRPAFQAPTSGGRCYWTAGPANDRPASRCVNPVMDDGGKVLVAGDVKRKRLADLRAGQRFARLWPAVAYHSRAETITLGSVRRGQRRKRRVCEIRPSCRPRAVGPPTREEIAVAAHPEVRGPGRSAVFASRSADSGRDRHVRHRPVLSVGPDLNWRSPRSKN